MSENDKNAICLCSVIFIVVMTAFVITTCGIAYAMTNHYYCWTRVIAVPLVVPSAPPVTPYSIR